MSNAQNRLTEIQARLDDAREQSPTIRVLDLAAVASRDMDALVAALRAVIEDAEQVVASGYHLDEHKSQAGVTLALIEKHLGGAE